MGTPSVQCSVRVDVRGTLVNTACIDILWDFLFQVRATLAEGGGRLARMATRMEIALSKTHIRGVSVLFFHPCSYMCVCLCEGQLASAREKESKVVCVCPCVCVSCVCASVCLCVCVMFANWMLESCQSRIC